MNSEALDFGNPLYIIRYLSSRIGSSEWCLKCFEILFAILRVAFRLEAMIHKFWIS